MFLRLLRQPNRLVFSSSMIGGNVFCNSSVSSARRDVNVIARSSAFDLSNENPRNSCALINRANACSMLSIRVSGSCSRRYLPIPTVTYTSASQYSCISGVNLSNAPSCSPKSSLNTPPKRCPGLQRVTTDQFLRVVVPCYVGATDVAVYCTTGNKCIGGYVLVVTSCTAFEAQVYRS